ncbi:hypothetical protein QUF50_09640, partial [Thiotrichales bacterium HSG1]|nr:hypothetical protein [Thiotrichales bacterium HSG1]
MLIKTIIIILILFFSGESISKPEKSELQEELKFLQAELITVKTASGVEETLLDAPATMVVITAEEIKQRGYSDLAEVIMDLSGFDVTIANGT